MKPSKKPLKPTCAPILVGLFVLMYRISHTWSRMLGGREEEYTLSRVLQFECTRCAGSRVRRIANDYYWRHIPYPYTSSTSTYTIPVPTALRKPISCIYTGIYSRDRVIRDILASIFSRKVIITVLVYIPEI